MRIDVHSHLVYLPYLEYLSGRSSLPQGVLRGGTYFVSCTGGYLHTSPAAHADVDQKLRAMEDLGIGISVLSHGMPGPELLGSPEADAWAARINDHLADLMQTHPGKFEAWATLGWYSIDQTISEIDRCVNQLGFKGVYLFSNINQRTIDAKEFWPVYRYIESLGVPINMHPTAPLNMNAIDHRPLVPGMAFMFDTASGHGALGYERCLPGIPGPQVDCSSHGWIRPLHSWPRGSAHRRMDLAGWLGRPRAILAGLLRPAVH